MFYVSCPWSSLPHIIGKSLKLLSLLMVPILGSFLLPLQTHSSPSSFLCSFFSSVSGKPLACSKDPLGFWLLTISQHETLAGEGKVVESRPWALFSPAPFLPGLRKCAAFPRQAVVRSAGPSGSQTQPSFPCSFRPRDGNMSIAPK